MFEIYTLFIALLFGGNSEPKPEPQVPIQHQQIIEKENISPKIETKEKASQKEVPKEPELIKKKTETPKKIPVKKPSPQKQVVKQPKTAIPKTTPKTPPKQAIKENKKPAPKVIPPIVAKEKVYQPPIPKEKVSIPKKEIKEPKKEEVKKQAKAKDRNAPYYTSSHSRAKYYYPVHCTLWEKLSPKYLTKFNTLDAVKSFDGGRTLHKDC